MAYIMKLAYHTPVLFAKKNGESIIMELL